MNTLTPRLDCAECPTEDCRFSSMSWLFCNPEPISRRSTISPHPTRAAVSEWRVVFGRCEAVLGGARPTRHPHTRRRGRRAWRSRAGPIGSIAENRVHGAGHSGPTSSPAPPPTPSLVRVIHPSATFAASVGRRLRPLRPLPVDPLHHRLLPSSPASSLAPCAFSVSSPVVDSRSTDDVVVITTSSPLSPPSDDVEGFPSPHRAVIAYS